MISLGIIGLGFMAATHIKAARNLPNLRLAALCNPSGRHLDGDFTQVAGNVGSQDPLKLDMTQIKAYRDDSALLADPSIDLVDICAPTAAHADLAIRALAAGKHVLCEKPLARTAAEAQGIARAASSATTFIMPAMCMRFWPGWSWLKNAIQDQRFGAVRAARFRRVGEPPAWGLSHFADGAKSGGALLDLHIHDTDFVQFCFGMPTEVVSLGTSGFSGAVDHVVTQYRVPSGAVVHAEGSWLMAPGFGFSMSFTVSFERATADYDLARGPDALRIFEKGQTPRIQPLEPGDGYIGELAYFADCIAAQTPPSVVTLDDAIRSLEICEAEERSVATGKPVSLTVAR